MPNILTDSCFWIGLFDENDQHHSEASKIYDKIKSNNKIIIPYPCMYEIVKTKLTKRKDRLAKFKYSMETISLSHIEDSQYKEKAQLEVFKCKEAHSLVDCIIREILKDENIKIDTLVTFNVKDFYDICSKGRRKIEVLNKG